MWRLLGLTFIVTVAVVASYDNSCDDPNAAPPPDGCYCNCNRKCINYLTNRTEPCSKLVCPSDKCGCKKGYYYDSNHKACVLPKDCTHPQD